MRHINVDQFDYWVKVVKDPRENYARLHVLDQGRAKWGNYQPQWLLFYAWRKSYVGPGHLECHLSRRG